LEHGLVRGKLLEEEERPMDQEELRERARRQAFKLILTTGATYDIHHPDLIMVGRHSVIVGITNQPGGQVYDRKWTGSTSTGSRICRPLPRQATCLQPDESGVKLPSANPQLTAALQTL
jgi:hypothetical protein